MSAIDADANVLGALALILTDRMERSVAAAAGGHSMTAAAALSALLHFLDRPTVDSLRRVLGLTPSGAVRLVDRLAAAGLVTRGPGADGRTRSITLTAKGRRAATRISEARAAVLASALAELTPGERQTLARLTGRMLGAMVQLKLAAGPDTGAWTCRLCDVNACGRPQGRCPAANAASAAIRGQTPGG